MGRPYIHPDFVYYRGDFHGNIINDARDFSAIVIEAKAFVDAMTRSDREEYLTIDRIKAAYLDAICSVAEEIYKQRTIDEGKQKQSESVGNHSVSYSVNAKSSEDRENSKHRKARTFLTGTGLLYRGLH